MLNPHYENHNLLCNHLKLNILGGGGKSFPTSRISNNYIAFRGCLRTAAGGFCYITHI